MKCLQVKRDGAASAPWMNVQEQDDLLQQLFWQRNANSKGQEAYFTQGLPKKRQLHQKGGSWCSF